MSEQTDDYDPEKDMWGSWWEAHFEIGKRHKAGEPLPDIFVPRAKPVQEELP